jgi:hypothetical protein
MATQLEQILAHTLHEVTARRAVADLALLERKAAALPAQPSSPS